MTLHVEPFSARDRAVVEGGFFPDRHVSARRDLELPDKPEGRGATVVTKVDRRGRWKHQMSIAVHRDRVDVPAIIGD